MCACLPLFMSRKITGGIVLICGVLLDPLITLFTQAMDGGCLCILDTCLCTSFLSMTIHSFLTEGASCWRIFFTDQSSQVLMNPWGCKFVLNVYSYFHNERYLFNVTCPFVLFSEKCRLSIPCVRSRRLCERCCDRYNSVHCKDNCHCAFG